MTTFSRVQTGVNVTRVHLPDENLQASGVCALVTYAIKYSA